MDETLKTELINMLQKANDLKSKIADDVAQIKHLEGSVRCKILDIVYKINDVDEMTVLCNELNLPTNTWYFEKAMANSSKRCPNHDLTEWHDVQSTVADDIESVFRKRAAGQS
jgi:hypothetical protein